jgi:hypothetical protein
MTTNTKLANKLSSTSASRKQNPSNVAVTVISVVAVAAVWFTFKAIANSRKSSTDSGKKTTGTKATGTKELKLIPGEYRISVFQEVLLQPSQRKSFLMTATHDAVLVKHNQMPALDFMSFVTEKPGRWSVTADYGLGVKDEWVLFVSNNVG